MVSVGIRDFKAKLSSYIDMVEKGEQVVITQHGEEVAIIIPISNERRAVRSMVKAGRAQWSGDRPKGIKGFKIKGKPLSVTILEERR